MANKVMRIHIKSAKNLENKDVVGYSDPFVIVYLNGKQVAQTKVINDNLSPVWNEHFEVPFDTINSLKLEVFDKDVVGKETLGYIEYSQDQAHGRLHGGPLVNGGIGTLDVDILVDRQKLDYAVGPPYSFPVRERCSVNLYHDAAADPHAPHIVDHNGNRIPYAEGECWRDVFAALDGAQKFIYLTGWSVDTTKTLLRTSRQQAAEGRAVVPDETLGQVLARKASQGVTVLVHIWDEATSNKISKGGLMGTHDEETFNFLNRNGCHCVKSYREGKSEHTSVIFSHHQKTIMVDAPLLAVPAPHQQHFRRIIAFVGGLDLCNGRWDTPRHAIFRTLGHEHADDFYMPWPVSGETGPRQPWHDIHAKVEGPVARDVLRNFVERWRKQAPKDKQYLLVDTTENGGIIPMEAEFGHITEPNDTWNVQLFRSIDEYSATIVGVEKSIQTAYVNAIRTAEHYLYIENQYFLGACSYWHDFRHAGCYHPIPFEIATKICQKIREKKPFCAYIVTPMYPEGYPESGPVQEILKWQHHTHMFMYRMVHDAIQEVYMHEDSAVKPKVTDYLNFYCLGQRETVHGSEAKFPDASKFPKSQEKDLELGKSRRFQIYVHSKMMIVDDAYIIVGSANINERSLAGNRDTEIAIGAYQPLRLTPQGGRGEIHKFRLALWGEHLGFCAPVFNAPQSAECARFINEIAEKNYDDYIRDEPVDLKSHLLSYPIVVDETGKVHQRRMIPDTKASIAGAAKKIMVDLLTT